MHRITSHISLALGLWLIVAAQADAQTWFQWSAAVGGNDHWYSLTVRANNWEGARAQALAIGPFADLVSINNEAERDFLAGQFGVSHLRWIGLTDKEVEGIWVWANGDAVDYTNWLPGQPDDFQSTPSGEGEDYALMNFGAFLEMANFTGWNDVSLNYGGFNGIVESTVMPLSVPEPGTYALLGSALGCLWLIRRDRRASRSNQSFGH